MLQSNDPAHFYNEADWIEIFEDCVWGGLTNYMGGRISSSLGDSDPALAGYFIRFASSLLADTLGDILNELCDESSQEQQIRQLRERLESADDEEQLRIRAQIRRLSSQHGAQVRERLLNSAIRNIFKEALTS